MSYWKAQLHAFNNAAIMYSVIPESLATQHNVLTFPSPFLSFSEKIGKLLMKFSHFSWVNGPFIFVSLWLILRLLKKLTLTTIACIIVAFMKEWSFQGFYSTIPYSSPIFFILILCIGHYMEIRTFPYKRYLSWDDEGNLIVTSVILLVFRIDLASLKVCSHHFMYTFPEVLPLAKEDDLFR